MLCHCYLAESGFFFFFFFSRTRKQNQHPWKDGSGGAASMQGLEAWLDKAQGQPQPELVVLSAGGPFCTDP